MELSLWNGFGASGDVLRPGAASWGSREPEERPLAFCVANLFASSRGPGWQASPLRQGGCRQLPG